MADKKRTERRKKPMNKFMVAEKEKAGDWEELGTAANSLQQPAKTDFIEGLSNDNES